MGENGAYSIGKYIWGRGAQNTDKNLQGHLAAALNVSLKEQFTTPRTLTSTKDLVVLANLTPKMLPKAGLSWPHVGWRSKLSPERGTLSSQANPDSFTALEIPYWINPRATQSGLSADPAASKKLD